MLKIKLCNCNVTNDIIESDSIIAAYYTPEHKDLYTVDLKELTLNPGLKRKKIWNLL